MKVEYAQWIDWHQEPKTDSAGRVYFGHETCATLLPSPARGMEFARAALGNGVLMSLITPFMTNEALYKTCLLIEAILTVHPGLEVICSDWGLVHHLCCNKVCEAVIGRVLTGQVTDPRMARMFNDDAQGSPSRFVTHLDGTTCLLKKNPPSTFLMECYKGCHLNRSEVIAYLMSLGVRRGELNNVAQGIELEWMPGWSYSLHIPDVLVSVMRRCPGNDEDLRAFRACPCLPEGETEWKCDSVSAGLFRRDNGLYYRFTDEPTNLERLPVDRIVRSHVNIQAPV